MNESSKVLIIIGCSRSGTSFTASWLHSMGLNLGENLIGPSEINLKGHFEDIEILRLHNKILKSNNTDYSVGLNKKIDIPEIYFEEAKEIYSLRSSKNKQWGWKEPRTCLFLKMWDQIIYDAYFLVVFRDFRQVVDSHIKMKKTKSNSINFFLSKLLGLFKFYFFGISKADKFLASWIRNNQDIITFYENSINKEEFIFCNVESILHKNEKIYTTLTDGWGFKLAFENPNGIFEKKLMHLKPENYNFDGKLENIANNIFDKLNSLSLKVEFHN